MNKSKFLKKSLAALLAILMVAAMIPLSAAAADPIVLGDGSIKASAGTLTRNEEGNDFLWTDALPYNVSAETVTITTDMENIEWYDVSGETPSRLATGKSVDVKVTGMAVGTDVTKTVEMRDTSKGNEVVGTYTITFTRLATSTSTELKSAKATISGEEYTTTEIDNAAHTITFSKLPWGVVDALNTTHTNLTVLSVEMAAPHSDAAKYTFNGTNANISAVQDTVDEGKAEIIVTAQSGKEQPYTVHFVESPCLTKLTIGGEEATLKEDGTYEVALNSIAADLPIEVESAKTRGVTYKIGDDSATVAASGTALTDGKAANVADVIDDANDPYYLAIIDEDDNAKIYTINIKLVKNSDTKVKSFTVNDGTYTEEGVVAENGGLSVALASGTDLPTAASNTIQLTMVGNVKSVTLNGAAGAAADSTFPTKYVEFATTSLNATNTLVVVAEDGTQKTYELKATVEDKNTKKPTLISGTVRVDDTKVSVSPSNGKVTFTLSDTEAGTVVDGNSIQDIINEALAGNAPTVETTFTIEGTGTYTSHEIKGKDIVVTGNTSGTTDLTIKNSDAEVTAYLGETVEEANKIDGAGKTVVVANAIAGQKILVVDNTSEAQATYTLTLVQDMSVASVAITAGSSPSSIASSSKTDLIPVEDESGNITGYKFPYDNTKDADLNAIKSITATVNSGATVKYYSDAACETEIDSTALTSGVDLSSAKVFYAQLKETADETNVKTYAIALVADNDPSLDTQANKAQVFAASPNAITVTGPFTWVSSAHSTVTIEGNVEALNNLVGGDYFNAEGAAVSYFNIVVTNHNDAPNNVAEYPLVLVKENANTESRLDSIAFHDAKSKDEIKATYKADVTQSPAEATVSAKLPYKLVEDRASLAVEYSISENAKLYYAKADNKLVLLSGKAFDPTTGKVSLTIAANDLVDVKKLVVVSESNTDSITSGTTEISGLTADTYTTYAFKAEREEPSAEAELLTLGTADNAVTSVIDTGAGTVEVTVPASYVEEGKETEFDLAVTASENATLDPADAKGVYVDAKVVEDNGKYKLMLDGSARTSIVVTAQDGKTKNTYAVTVKTREVESDATITGITVKDVAAEAGEENAYTVTLPAGTEYTVEDIVVATTSDTAKAVVEAGETEGVYTITVTAEDGTTTATYTLTVTVDDEPVIPAELKLESLTIGGVAVDLEAAELAVELPYGTELTEALAVEAIAAAGEAVKVESAVVVNEDGTAAVTVTVTDVNDETKTATYTVAVTVATEEPVLDSDASISGITVKDVAAEAGEENAYAVTLPAGTEYTTEDIVVATTSEKATAEVKAGETEGVYTITVTAEDGTVAEYTLTVTVEAAPVENPFQDIDPEDPDQWYAKSVLNAAAKGYIFGYDDGNFHAADNVTRAQFAAFVARLDGFDKDAAYELNFSDMEYVYGDLKAAVGYCVSKGYMNGYGGTTKFGPNDTITRQEMAIVLAKVLKLDTKNVTVTEKFEDDDKIADWAYNAVYACKNAGYLSGDGKNFDPTGSTDRGMAAVVLMQMDSAK